MFFPQGFNFPVRVKKHGQQIAQRVINRRHLPILGLPRRLGQSGKIRPDKLRVSQTHICHAVQKQRGSADLRAGAIQETLALPRRILVLRLEIMMGCQSNHPFFFIRKRPDHGFHRDKRTGLPDGHKGLFYPIHCLFLSWA